MRIIALLLLLTSSVYCQQVLKVVVTTPELSSLVKEIGTSLVEVKTLVKGREDPHYVEVLPSYVAAVNKADLVVKIGLELEIGWLPVVIQQSRNQKVQICYTVYSSKEQKEIWYVQKIALQTKWLQASVAIKL